MTTAKTIQDLISEKSDKEKGIFLQRFFKTGEGQYGAGDIFVGITVPVSRTIAKVGKDLPLSEIKELLQSPIHESRLIALIILVNQMKKATLEKQKEIVEFYLKHTKYVNNWDLVDTSAHYLLGAYLFSIGDWSLLKKLAISKDIWERRIAMVATYYFSSQKDPRPCLLIAEMLLKDTHDLIHKATGWMLREAGKKCGEKVLLSFLDKHAKMMPRTALRYAIEKLTPEQRKHYMKR